MLCIPCELFQYDASPQQNVRVPNNHGRVVWKRGHVFCSGSVNEKRRNAHKLKSNLPQIFPSRSAVAGRRCEQFYLCFWLHIATLRGVKGGAVFIFIYKMGLWSCTLVLIPANHPVLALDLDPKEQEKQPDWNENVSFSLLKSSEISWQQRRCEGDQPH